MTKGQINRAESKFDKLSNEIAKDYEKKGKSKKEADKIGNATAYKIGVAKYGKQGMERKARAGRAMNAESFGAEEKCPMPDYQGKKCGKGLYSSRLSPRTSIGRKTRGMKICGDCAGLESYAKGLGEWVDKYPNRRHDAETFNADSQDKKYCIGCGTPSGYPHSLEKLPYQVGLDGKQAYSCRDCFDEVREAESFGADEKKRRGMNITPKIQMVDYTDVMTEKMKNQNMKDAESFGADEKTKVTNITNVGNKVIVTMDRNDIYEGSMDDVMLNNYTNSRGQEIRFNGEGVPEGFHKMPDGTIMADSAHGAESFGLGKVLGIVNPSERSENDDPRQLYVTIGFDDGEIYRGYVELDSEYEMDEQGHQRMKQAAESFAADGMDFKEAAKTGFGIAAGFTLFNVSLFGIAAVAGIVMSKK